MVRVGSEAAASDMTSPMSTSSPAAECSERAASAAPLRSSALAAAGAVVSGRSLPELDSSVSASSAPAPSPGAAGPATSALPAAAAESSMAAAAASTASARKSRTRCSMRSVPISARTSV